MKVEKKFSIENRVSTELNSVEELLFVFLKIFDMFINKTKLMNYLKVDGVGSQTYYNFLNGKGVGGSKLLLSILIKMGVVKQEIYDEVRYRLINEGKINYEKMGVIYQTIYFFKTKKVEKLNLDHLVKICNYFQIQILNLNVEPKFLWSMSYEGKFKKIILPLISDKLIEAGADSTEWTQLISNQLNKNNSTDSLEKLLKESVGGLKLHEGEVNIPQLEAETGKAVCKEGIPSVDKRILNFFEFCKKNSIKEASIELEEGFKTFKISFEDNKKKTS